MDGAHAWHLSWLTHSDIMFIHVVECRDPMLFFFFGESRDPLLDRWPEFGLPTENRLYRPYWTPGKSSNQPKLAQKIRFA